MPNTLGDKTQTVFLKVIERTKLHQQFVVAAATTINLAQPVQLNAAGEVVPFAAVDHQLLLGYAIHGGEAEELITVACRGIGMIWTLSNAALDAGKVTNNAFDADSGLLKVIQSINANDYIGWAIDAATAADEKVRVILR